MPYVKTGAGDWFFNKLEVNENEQSADTETEALTTEVESLEAVTQASE